MTNFNPVGTGSLNDKLFNFSETESYNDNFEALDIFWKYIQRNQSIISLTFLTL